MKSFSQFQNHAWFDSKPNLEYVSEMTVSPNYQQKGVYNPYYTLKVADDKGITISTDLNYREKLWKYNGDREKIMTELTSYCDIILGNEEDAEKHFGIKPEAIDVNKNGENVKAESFLSTKVSTNVKLERAVLPVFSIFIMNFIESPTSLAPFPLSSL